MQNFARTTIIQDIDISAAVNISYQINILGNPKVFPFPTEGAVRIGHISITFKKSGTPTNPGNVNEVEIWKHTNIHAVAPSAWVHTLTQRNPGKFDISFDFMGVPVSAANGLEGLTNWWIVCPDRGTTTHMTVVIDYTNIV